MSRSPFAGGRAAAILASRALAAPALVGPLTPGAHAASVMSIPYGLPMARSHWQNSHGPVRAPPAAANDHGRGSSGPQGDAAARPDRPPATLGRGSPAPGRIGSPPPRDRVGEGAQERVPRADRHDPLAPPPALDRDHLERGEPLQPAREPGDGFGTHGRIGEADRAEIEHRGVLGGVRAKGNRFVPQPSRTPVRAGLSPPSPARAALSARTRTRQPRGPSAAPARNRAPRALRKRPAPGAGAAHGKGSAPDRPPPPRDRPSRHRRAPRSTLACGRSAKMAGLARDGGEFRERRPFLGRDGDAVVGGALRFGGREDALEWGSLG